MADTFFSGLIRTPEDREWLKSNSRKLLSAAAAIEYPPEFDPRSIIRVEDQGPRNSCVGHGLSSCGEVCAYLDSGGELRPQFSRWGCYILAQQEGGMAGRDVGATISGAVRAAVKYGFPTDQSWPYPATNERYTSRIPSGAIDTGKPTQLLGHSVIKSYADGFAWMNQGKGPLLIGVDWTSGLASGTGDVTLADLRTKSLGGHCMFIWGWMTDGRLWLGNSHGVGWGQQGWRPIRPEVLEHWASREEVYGLSDLKDITVNRPVVCDFGEGM